MSVDEAIISYFHRHMMTTEGLPDMTLIICLHGGISSDLLSKLIGPYVGPAVVDMGEQKGKTALRRLIIGHKTFDKKAVNKLHQEAVEYAARMVSENHTDSFLATANFLRTMPERHRLVVLSAFPPEAMTEIITILEHEKEA